MIFVLAMLMRYLVHIQTKFNQIKRIVELLIQRLSLELTFKYLCIHNTLLLVLFYMSSSIR